MIDDIWRVRTRLLKRAKRGGADPIELGFGDLAEMVAKAIRMPTSVLASLYLRIEADGRLVEADEMRKISEHREFPILI